MQTSPDDLAPGRAAEVLELHNAWRRGEIEDSPDATDPKLIGRAIEVAIAALRAQAR